MPRKKVPKDPTLPPRKHARRYPWKVWFTKLRFVLVKGVDFDGLAYAMSQMVRVRAKEYGVRVSVGFREKWGEEKLFVKVLGPVGGPNFVKTAEEWLRDQGRTQ